MSKQPSVYTKLVVIAIVLIALAGALYVVVYRDPLKTDKRAVEVQQHLSRLDHDPSATDADRREFIEQELMDEHNYSFMQSIFEHLAEALLLAAVMILTVEILTRSAVDEETETTLREILEEKGRITQELLAEKKAIVEMFTKQANQASANVFHALLQQMVPETIVAEIKKILRSEICRVQTEYTIYLMKCPHEGLPKDHIVVRRELYYRIFNLTGGEIPHSVDIEVRSYAGDHTVFKEDGTQIKYPRICQVDIQDKEIPLREDQRKIYSQPITLPAMRKEKEAIAIWSRAEEVCTTTDRALYVFSKPCDGVKLKIINMIPSMVAITKESNIFLTNGKGRLRKENELRQDNETWVCEGGVLPGTTLSISWQAVVPKKT